MTAKIREDIDDSLEEELESGETGGEETPVSYTAKIKKAKKEFSLPDNASYLDIWFDLMLDGKPVAERRLGFPMGTEKEAIVAELKAYCQMFANDHALAAKVAEKAKVEAEAESVLVDLEGVEV